MQSMGIEKVVMIRNHIKTFWFSILILMLYLLYVNAHIHNNYLYEQYSITYERVYIEIDLYPDSSNRYLFNGRKRIDSGTPYKAFVSIYPVGIDLTSEIEVETFTIESLESNSIYKMISIGKKKTNNSKGGNYQYRYEPIDLSSKKYGDMGIYLEVKINFSDGKESTYLIEGVIKSNFEWKFGWDTFDMIMSV